MICSTCNQKMFQYAPYCQFCGDGPKEYRKKEGQFRCPYCNGIAAGEFSYCAWCGNEFDGEYKVAAGFELEETCGTCKGSVGVSMKH